MGLVQPECRICGTPVKNFGDYCEHDKPEDDMLEDGLMEIVKNDLYKLTMRGEE